MRSHIMIISPPFYSHLNPLLSLGLSLKQYGADVTVGCSQEFETIIKDYGLGFCEFDISNNRNIGSLANTIQAQEEHKRLDDFFEATKKGAIETLIYQTENRKADMLKDPKYLIDGLLSLEHEHVDLYVSDILSYGVTLALKALNLPFITFCPPHPYTLPDDNNTYGIPRTWPQEIYCNKNKLDLLAGLTKSVEEAFTKVFNDYLETYNDQHVPIENAFAVKSDLGIIYNYPDFTKDNDHQDMAIYMGYSFLERPLDHNWIESVSSQEEKILISFGTFLSDRLDVIEKLITYLKHIKPEAKLFVAGGPNTQYLKTIVSPEDVVSDFLPQSSLVPYMDLVIHHGGCNSFTETLYYGKPMIVLPFSSDQFNIANDIRDYGIGQVLDPNHFGEEDLYTAIHQLEIQSNSDIEYWSKEQAKLGPDFAAKQIMKKIV